jgi:hypothetical protein
MLKLFASSQKIVLNLQLIKASDICVSMFYAFWMYAIWITIDGKRGTAELDLSDPDPGPDTEHPLRLMVFGRTSQNLTYIPLAPGGDFDTLGGSYPQIPAGIQCSPKGILRFLIERSFVSES